MAQPRVLAIVLAGGEGKRLMPLTVDRAKPAVPFGGIYRLIDFSLSNMINSGFLKVVVLTQYKSHSLDRHISKTWRMSDMLGNYIAPVPAQQRVASTGSWGAPTRSTSPSTCSTTSGRTTWSSPVRTTSTAWTSPRCWTITSPPGLPCTVAGIRQPPVIGGPVRRHRDRPDRPRQDQGLRGEAQGHPGPAGLP